MIENPPIAQSDLRCATCAGQCAFTPTTGQLTCHSCGACHDIKIDRSTDPTIEHRYDPALPHTEQPETTPEHPYGCETCGGEVIFAGHSMSENCPYCDGALVERLRDESYPTLGMIPFAIASDTAQENVQNWVAKRWAAPSDLSSHASRSRVAGIYVPFWTFDSHEAVDYTIRYDIRRGKRTISKTHTGFMNHYFDDLLMPASDHITPLIRDGILHDFNPRDLRPFNPAYLAGFAAERHHLSVRQGLKNNAPDKALLLRNRIKSHSGKSNITNISYKTDTTGIKYRRILLPVWIMHYEYAGKPMKIVTCGLHGRTYGERPFSIPKLLALAVLAATAVSIFGFLWGAGGLY